jgi:ADP-heptose:LPS heptosyltransferase
MQCPICNNNIFIPFNKLPAYKICPFCNFYLQEGFKLGDMIAGIADSVKDTPGIVIRLPNVDVTGFEKTSCPYMFSNQSVSILALKMGWEVCKVVNRDGTGCTDFNFRVKRGSSSISVFMIVKNEEQNILDCLESVKGIAAELIVVDTGSTDKTKEVVSKYTDNIFDFNWVDDFSAARNFALSKCSMDWCLWMDADDVLENPEEIQSLLKQEFDAFNFNIKYGGEYYCHARLFKNFKNIRFSGRVHEYPVLGPSLRLKSETLVNVIHKTEKACTEDRSERNYRILKKETEEGPNNSRAFFYMANALKEMTKYDEAIKTYQHYLTMNSWLDERWMAQKYIGQILERQKKHEEAIEAFIRAIEIDDRWAEPLYYIGECYYYLNDFNKCIEWMLKAKDKPEPSSPLWKEKIVYNDGPYRYLSACYNRMGDNEKSLYYCKIASEKRPDDLWIKQRCSFLESNLKADTKIIECYRQGALGDCLMTTAALRGLKQKFPGCFIRYITHPHSRQVLEGNQYIDELTEKPGENASMKVYFCYPDKNSTLRDEGYPNKPLTRHIVEIFNECAGLTENEMALECTLSPEEDQIGQDLKAQYKSYLTVHTTAGWSPYKNWFDDRWQFVVEELFKKGYMTLQIGHSTDPLLPNAIDFRGRTVKEAVSAIKYAEVHMGVDSFSSHASFAVGTPAVILYGSTSPVGSGYSKNINLYHNLDCQPCYKEHKWSKDNKGSCGYNRKCMDLISSDEVLASVLKLLNK